MTTIEQAKDAAQRAVATGDVKALDESVRTLESLLVADDMPGLRADVFRYRGILFSLQGNYEEAIESYRKALDVLEPMNDVMSIARITNNMGVAYHTKADYPNAVYWYRRSLDAREALNDKVGIARVAGNIGIVYSSLGDINRARSYYERSLEISRELNDAEGVARGNAIVGNMHVRLGDLTKAEPFLHEAITMSKNLGMEREWLTAASSLAAIFQQSKEYEKALEVVQEAEPVAIRLGLRREALLLNIARSYSLYHIHGSTEHLEQLRSLLAEAQEMSLANEEMEIHELLFRLFKHRADYESALRHHELWIDLRDRIAGETRQRQLIHMEAEQKLSEERRKTEEHQRLLHNMVPKEIAARLLVGESRIADEYECVSVLFTDIVDFTVRASRLKVEDLITMLNDLFSKFDTITRNNGVTKIKTIGDAYMAVAGAPIPMDACESAKRSALCALQMSKLSNRIPIRVGLHAGPVVAGVIGTERMVWDVWGDTVNVASRMENTSQAGRVQVSEDFARLLSNGAAPAFDGTDIVINAGPFRMKMRGTIDVKGKGEMKTFWLEQST